MNTIAWHHEKNGDIRFFIKESGKTIGHYHAATRTYDTTRADTSDQQSTLHIYENKQSVGLEAKVIRLLHEHDCQTISIRIVGRSKRNDGHYDVPLREFIDAGFDVKWDDYERQRHLTLTHLLMFKRRGNQEPELTTDMLFSLRD